MAAKKVRVDFDFQDNEAGGDMLEIKAGEIITITEEGEEGGWWRGKIGDKEGFFPITYCTVLGEQSPRPKPASPVQSSFAISSQSVGTEEKRAFIKPGPPKFQKKNNDGVIGHKGRVDENGPPPALPYFNKSQIQVWKNRGNLIGHQRVLSRGNPLAGRKGSAYARVHGDSKKPKKRRSTFRKAGLKALEQGVQVKTQFNVWAKNSSMITAIYCVVLGFCALIWGAVDEERYGITYGIIGTYTVVLGAYIILFERFFCVLRSPSAIPTRGFMYFVVGAPCFLTQPTIIAAVSMYITGLINCVAAFYEEEVKPKQKKRRARAAPVKSEGKSNVLHSAGGVDLVEAEPSLWEQFKAWLVFLQNGSKLGVKVFILCYIVANIILFAYAVQLWFGLNAELDEDDQISTAGPLAKGFGWTLDFNCAMILVPVCRNLLSIVYDYSNGKSCFGRCLGVIVTFIPVDKNIAFHKFVAVLMAAGAMGHMFFHFVNYALRPDATIRLFGLIPWYTGGLIIICVLLIFSGAQLKVRRKQFEIFWYSHIFVFPVYYVLLLLHGKPGYNPNFWKWFVLPAFLYLTERVVTWRRAKLPVTLLSVSVMKPNVFSIELEKSGPFAAKKDGRHPYSEGQYCFINCPHLSAFEWHPFTISSAPSDKTVTFHIRRSVPGSWTDQLQEYLTALGDSSTGRLTLFRNVGASRVPGKIIGPDGRRLLRIDGPHSAPTQHLSKYKQVMIIGAGIGVTPVASSVKSVIFHKWRTAVGEVFPNHGYFYWVCSHRDVDSFRWMIRLIKECQDEISHQRAKASSTRRYEFHIFITSVRNAKPVQVVVAPEDDESFWGRHTEDTGVEKKQGAFNEAQLYGVLKCPTQDVQQIGDVFVHKGRPNWKAEFARVKAYHRNDTVGVAFCGNEHIANDLKRYSMQSSDVENGQLFRLHLENF